MSDFQNRLAVLMDASLAWGVAQVSPSLCRVLGHSCPHLAYLNGWGI